MGKLPITAVILSGGRSVRMGTNKALLPYGEEPLIQHIARGLGEVCAEVLISANDRVPYEFLNLPIVPDDYPGSGPLAGIHAGLKRASLPWVLAIACDMPHWSPDLLRRLTEITQQGRADVICPQSEGGPEPLHALYNRRCIPFISNYLGKEVNKITAFYPEVRVTRLPWDEVREIDPDGNCFRNWNRPEDVHQQVRTGGSL